MKDFLCKLANEKINPFIFVRSEDKLLFRELLKANKMIDDGMNLEGNIPGFKINLTRAYLVFILFWHLVLLPLVGIFHVWIAKIDCHALIITSVVFSWLFFASFSIFRSLLVEVVAKSIVKDSWKIHFPHFDYEKHHVLVSRLYGEAVEKELPKKDLELFIINGIVTK
jgi:hypothetical protein